MQGAKKRERKATYSFPFDEADRNPQVKQPKRIMYKIKEGPKEYSWPCDNDPERKITVTTDDLFSKTKDGTVIKHTGVGCYGIEIPEEDLEEIYE
ncbi:MAG: hypothetical protein K9N09_12280 [Candidatus Cloacimonetes bacterium]|nr:hypothetical protein [Candidatus Cloacimonadota bacterium]MCF7884830.1 hypothetical protein [Candidatus Cloacimonadota bacterium]